MDEGSEGIGDFDHVHNGLELKLSSVREECTCGASSEDCTVSELRSSFDEVLQVEDAEKENVDFPTDTNACIDITMTITEKSTALGGEIASIYGPAANFVKHLCRCASFPATGCISSTSVDDNDNPHDNVPYIRTVSLPVPRKVISALKGSREKEGLSLRKLSVSWDPEVYDPPPTSVSHLPKRNNQSYRSNKKHGKGKQKGKNAQGSRKKDKKHHRKGGERAESSLGLSFAMDPFLASNIGMPLSSHYYKPTNDPILASDTDTGMIPSSSYKPTMEHPDFDNADGNQDNPDSNCGSSFMRRSHDTMHYPYAEAT